MTLKGSHLSKKVSRRKKTQKDECNGMARLKGDILKVRLPAPIALYSNEYHRRSQSRLVVIEIRGR